MFSHVAVTEYVDALEPLLAANRDAYLAGPRTLDRQREAIQYFDQQWTWLK